MLAFYLTLLILGLTIFIMAIFGNLDHDFSVGDHDFSIGDHDFDTDSDFSGDHDLSHDAEAHTASPGLFSVRTISALFAGFGLAGIIAKLVLEWGIGGQLLLGFGAGLVLAGVAYLIMWGFYSQQAGGVRDAATLIGKVAVVTTGIGSQGIGECRVENNHYTFREKNGVKMQPNEVGKVIESEVGLLIVEKV